MTLFEQKKITLDILVENEEISFHNLFLNEDFEKLT